jgi:hypothetical protein
MTELGAHARDLIRSGDSGIHCQHARSPQWARATPPDEGGVLTVPSAGQP